ncbi:hypothetical protein [Sphingomonas koreensis]|nr:hypothetical protein [Sphingomonas koreensis]
MTASSLRATTALIPIMLLAAPVAAQDSTPPAVITPPVRDFSLPPSGQTPSPAPTPTPTPAATVQPVPIPTPSATAAARVPTGRSTPAAARAPAADVPAASASETAPAPAASPTPPPAAISSPELELPQPSPTSAVAPPVAPEGLPGWLWPALGGVLLLAAGSVAGWWFGRRRRLRDVEEAQPEGLEVPASAPTPGPPPLSKAPPVPVAPAVPAAPMAAKPVLPSVPPPDGPLVTEIRPMRAAIRDGMVTLDLELFIQNRGHESADNIRAVLTLLGANAEQDAQISTFHGAARIAAGSEPFSIAPGAIHALNVQVSLPGDQMQVVTVQGKPMFVPIVPVSLKWYAGLSIRTLRDAFMVGTAPAAGGDRLGPLWVERAGEGFGRLAAKRYVPKA